MRPSEVLAKHREAALAIIARYPVRNPRIFGSVARGEDTEASDIDILVDRGDDLTFIDLARMERELAELLGTSVEVQTQGGLAVDVRTSVAPDLKAL